MAKRLLLLAAGAIALTACTSEDVVEDVAASRNIIKFDNVVNKHSRAVEDLILNNLNKFYVFGFYTMPENDNHAHAIFNNEEVKKEGSGWSYGNNYRYWVPGATYYFYAYSCGSVSKLSEDYGDFSVDMDDEGTGNGKPATARVLEIDNYLCDYTHQHDLIFAASTPYKAGDGVNSDVSFTFNHILSKLTAKFTSSFSKEYTLVIENVRIENICNQGDYKFTSGWTNVHRKSGTPIVYLQNTTGTGIKKPEASLDVKNETVTIDDKTVQAFVTTQSAYVIPHKYADNDSGKKDVYLKFTVKLMYGNDFVVSKGLTATFQPEWKDGYSYIYNINVDPEDLKLGKVNFTVDAVGGWTKEDPITLPIDK